mgnify:CR=1 FL=1
MDQEYARFGNPGLYIYYKMVDANLVGPKMQKMEYLVDAMFEKSMPGFLAKQRFFTWQATIKYFQQVQYWYKKVKKA